MVRRVRAVGEHDAGRAADSSADKADRVRVGLFGPLSVRVNGSTLGPRDFGGSKPRQLFELLVLARGRPVTKDRLADELWGEDLPANMAATLEKYVSIVRRRLAPARLIDTLPHAYRFAVERADLDLDRFDALIERAGDLGPSEQRQSLELALALVRGDVAEDDPFAPWAEHDRARYGAIAVRAHLDAARAALTCRDLDAAHTHGERALARDVLSEEACRVLMLAAYACGRQGEALRHFEDCRTMLGRELGVEPMPETERLCRLIRQHVDPNELLPAPAWDQIPAAIDLRAPNVPFLGRTSELDHVTGLIDSAMTARRYSLVHVVGASTLGKTRLVVEVMARMSRVSVGKARCARVESQLPFVLLAMAVLAALPPDAPDPLAAVLSELGAHATEADQLRSLETLARTIVANGPTVLVLDDAQWADTATLTALSYLRHRCRAVPLAVVVTFDPLLVDTGHPLTALRPEAVVSLGPLGRAEVDEVGWPGLYDRTRGHPLLVAACLETRDHGHSEELVLRLSPWVLERAAEVGEQAQRLLVTAAVLGRPFSPEDLSTFVGDDLEEAARELEALCRRGLLVADESGFDFTAPLLREILAASISPARRRLVRERLDRHRLRGVAT